MKKWQEMFVVAVIYFSLGLVLVESEITPFKWQYWAILFLFIFHQWWIDRMRYRAYRKTVDEIQAVYDSSLIDLGNRLKQLFSATSMPADTNPHDAKPPQP